MGKSFEVMIFDDVISIQPCVKIWNLHNDIHRTFAPSVSFSTGHGVGNQGYQESTNPYISTRIKLFSIYVTFVR